MMRPETLKFAAQPEALELIRQWLAEMGTRYALPESTVGELNVILEELVMNVIKHAVAVPPEKPPIPVCIEMDIANDVISLRVADHSLPFDPLSRPAPDFSLDLDDMPIGGLGVHLVRQMTDSFEHTYEHGWNVSHLRKSNYRENGQ